MNEDARCAICDNLAEHSHHIYPQHLGGEKNSAQVNLCASHHDQIHQAAKNIFKNKPVEMQQPYLNRAMPLIRRILHAMLAAEQRDLSNVPSRIILKVPRHKLKQIHRRKMDLGFSSLEQYFGYLVNKDLPP